MKQACHSLTNMISLTRLDFNPLGTCRASVKHTAACLMDPNYDWYEITPLLLIPMVPDVVMATDWVIGCSSYSIYCGVKRSELIDHVAPP